MYIHAPSMCWAWARSSLSKRWAFATPVVGMFRYVLNMLSACYGHVLITCWICSTHVLCIPGNWSGTCAGRALGMCWYYFSYVLTMCS